MSLTGTAQRGFTLVELGIVLLIFTVLVAVVLPRFGNHDRYELRRQARSIAALLEVAAEEAVLTGRELRLVVDLAGQQLRLEARDGDGYRLVRDELLQAMAVHPPVRLETASTGASPSPRDGELYLILSPTGPTSGLFLDLGLESDRNAHCQIAFDPVFERVVVPQGQACG
jgi:type II secretion system protein H